MLIMLLGLFTAAYADDPAENIMRAAAFDVNNFKNRNWAIKLSLVDLCR